MKTYIIANGGCGERLASVMLTLYQCGFYGTDPIDGVLIIDNDAKNGAKATLERLIGFVNDMNKVISFNPKSVSSLFWQPKVSDNMENLADIDLDHDAQMILKLIMTKDEREQKLKDKGFSGCVNLGVTIANTALELEDTLDEKHGTEKTKQVASINEFLDNLHLSVDDEVRFIIMGSTHGGTGASLNTAIAKKIRDCTRDKQEKIHIFGLFMLTYYTFPKRKEPNGSVDFSSENGDTIHIDPAQFRPSDIEALEGYMKMGLVDDAFENILFCGFYPRILTSSKNGEGGTNQDNRFSIPELIMCAGAHFIFDNPVTVQKHKYLGINLQGSFNGVLNWSNVPYGDYLRECIGAMGLFACTMTEETKLARWNSFLDEGFGGKGLLKKNQFYYKSPTDNLGSETAAYTLDRESVEQFIKLFWKMLYEMSTTIGFDMNGNTIRNWNNMIGLFNSLSFENNELNGFSWVRDERGDATIVVSSNPDAVQPSLYGISESFKSNLSNISGTNSDLENRKRKYFGDLFIACKQEFGLMRRKAK